MGKVVIIMGSKSDFEHSKKIKKFIENFEVKVILRVASAHKTPLKVLDIIREYEKDNVVFITVAGRSNALSGFVDANTTRPVIACPPYSEKFSNIDIFSSLRMPSGVSPAVLMEPELAALASLKILSLVDKNLIQKIKKYQGKKKTQIEKADKIIRKNGKC